jgi:hypothetical protein
MIFITCVSGRNGDPSVFMSINSRAHEARLNHSYYWICPRGSVHKHLVEI